MTDFRYGDVLGYKHSIGDENDYRFMYIGPMPDESRLMVVVVLSTHSDDDLWVPGTILGAGIGEFDVVSD